MAPAAEAPTSTMTASASVEVAARASAAAPAERTASDPVAAPWVGHESPPYVGSGACFWVRRTAPCAAVRGGTAAYTSARRPHARRGRALRWARLRLVKLVVAIVHNEDAGALVDALLAREYRATRLHSSGGFLKQSNATVMVGVEEDQVDDVMSSSARSATRARRSSTRCRRSWSRASSSCRTRSRSRSAGRPCSSSRSSASNACEPPAAQDHPLVRPEHLDARAPRQPAVHAARRPPLHARRHDRRRAGRRGRAPGARHRHDLHQARRGADQLSQAQEVADHYLELLARIKTSDIDGEISVKPTQLGLDIDEDACFAHLRTLAAAAEAQGSYLWIDMEDSAYVDRTLDLYQRLRATCPRPASACRPTCAGPRRTSSASCRSIRRSAWSRAPTTSPRRSPSGAARGGRQLPGIAVTLLRESRTRPLRIGLGTHDVELVQQIATHAGAAGIPKQDFEVQMLFGIRAKEQRRLRAAGTRSRP